MDELDRLYRRVVDNIRGTFPELLARGFEVSQLYQQIVPYRTNRRELGFDSNEEYELALMQLLAGLRGYLTTDGELQRAMRTELASPNPDLTAFRIYATSLVALAPEPLRTLERRLLTHNADRTPSNSLSASEQATLAGRATEAFDVAREAPAAPTVPSSARGREGAPAAPRSSTPPAPPAPPPRPRAPTPPPPPVAQAARPAPASPSASALPSAPAAPPAPPAPSVSPMTVPRATAPAPSAGASCRYCGGALPDGRRVTFCPSCGHNVTVQHCPACATELEVDWKFCITCGRGIDEGDGTRA